MNDDEIYTLCNSEELLKILLELKRSKGQAAITRMTDFLRKFYLYKYRSVGKIQYGEMVADAKRILSILGIINTKKQKN